MPAFAAIKLFVMAYRIWFQLAAVGAIIAAVWFGVHKYNESLREEGRAEVRVEAQKAVDEALKDKQDTEDYWKGLKEKSDENAAKRIKTLASNLATANLINSGLRGEADNLRSILSDPSIGTSPDGAITIKAVLGDCARELERYATKDTELATSCDRHVNDLQSYREQWPRKREGVK